jgi:hypothetical protein
MAAAKLKTVKKWEAKSISQSPGKDKASNVLQSPFAVKLKIVTKPETEEQRKKRYQNDIQVARVKVVQKDLERREAIKLQALARGHLTRKRNQPIASEMTMNSADLNDEVSEKEDLEQSDELKTAELQAEYLPRPSADQTSGDDSLGSLVPETKSTAVEVGGLSVEDGKDEGANPVAINLSSTSKKETEDEKKKRQNELQASQLEIAQRDLERREVTKLQALARGCISRKQNNTIIGSSQVSLNSSVLNDKAPEKSDLQGSPEMEMAELQSELTSGSGQTPGGDCLGSLIPDSDDDSGRFETKPGASGPTTAAEKQLYSSQNDKKDRLADETGDESVQKDDVEEDPTNIYVVQPKSVSQQKTEAHEATPLESSGISMERDDSSVDSTEVEIASDYGIRLYARQYSG